ncbi:unnamed protein product [Toxocara canis]|uniref:Transmembrane protein 230 n=1 Tax=Toxocara canis TaxID=6265 RepID=A0A183UK40_TOXCA|nr:unnamed protein product [Toxocara canis]
MKIRRSYLSVGRVGMLIMASAKYSHVFQYDLPASRIPWKAVLLAGVLFVSGFVLIMSSLLMLSEVVKPSRADRVWPIFALGLIMFVPGAYHVRIAYHAFRGDSGFSFDDIPDFD